MASVSKAIESEYNAHLSALEAQRSGILQDPAALAQHDEAVLQFSLKAAPILSRASQEQDPCQQQLYEEMAVLTDNSEALRRIEQARKRRIEDAQASHRPHNKRKTRDRGQHQWISEDIRCSGCGASLIHVHSLRQAVCPQCGRMEDYCIDDSFEGLPFGEREPVSVSSYSRQTHMAELLAQVQGTEQTEVPEEVVEALRKQLKKHRLLDEPQQITPVMIRSHLKQLKTKQGETKQHNITKWYDNAMQLANIVSGGKCPQLRLPNALVHDIHNSFAAAQEPFAIAIQNSKRTNFLAYSYFCHKRCQINGFEQYARVFKLLKSRDKANI